MIDNGNLTSNGSGAAAQLVVPPAAPLDAPSVDASPETLLFRADLLSPDQLGELVQERVVSGRAVEEIVVERGWLDAETVARVLGGAPAAPAPEAHPDPFALPLGEHPAEPLPAQPFAAEPVPAASFAPAPEQQPQPVILETPPAPFVPAAVEPAAPEVTFPTLPVETAMVLEPIVLEPAALEPAAPEPAALEPAAPEPAAPEPAALASTGVEFRVSIRFVGNDCVEVGAYADAVEAKAAAHALVVQLSSERVDWPFAGGRFVRPEAVLSVDVDAIVR